VVLPLQYVLADAAGDAERGWGFSESVHGDSFHVGGKNE
jgi:hypothetical protein